MSTFPKGTLESYLDNYAGDDALKRAVASAVLAAAEASRILAGLLASGTAGGGHSAVIGANLGGDAQKSLDLEAHGIVRDALKTAGVAFLASEEADEVEELDPNGLVAVATDPLDGSSNIDTNVSIGTIFSILPAAGADTFLQPGTAQLAAGYVVYGPHTDFVLSVGVGTAVFTLDRETGVFRLLEARATIEPDTAEFAINASNYRHWFEGIRQYVDDCLAGAEGPREKDFNMRWIGSMVAEASRILVRGGVFLYPRDSRRGYADGRIRLVYEANPIAFLIEQAGGRASDGSRRIMDVVPADVHQRTPLIFGSASEVGRIERYEENPSSAERSPLFGYRGLFRA